MMVSGCADWTHYAAVEAVILSIAQGTNTLCAVEEVGQCRAGRAMSMTKRNGRRLAGPKQGISMAWHTWGIEIILG